MIEKEQDRKYDVLCVGLALGNVMAYPVPRQFQDGDTVQVDEISMMCGGDAFNQASVLAALGHSAALISKVADDIAGNMVLSAMNQRSVDTSMVAIDTELGTSNCIVLVRDDGQRNFCTYKGCLRTFCANDIDFEAVKNARAVSIGGLFSLPAFDQEASIQLFKRARDSNTITVADTKYDAFHIGLAGIKDLLKYTDYFFPSYEEAAYLSGLSEPEQIAVLFSNQGARHVGIKLGGEGCYLRTNGFSGIIPAFHSEVLDTTGAGDNFMAGLIHGILEGWDLKDSVLYANAAGALAVSRFGATSNEEYFEPIKRILNQRQEGKRLIQQLG